MFAHPIGQQGLAVTDYYGVKSFACLNPCKYVGILMDPKHSFNCIKSKDAMPTKKPKF